jgi:hypothetical protein
VFNQDPVAIMHGDISERFFGHPDLVFVIIGPSADSKGFPRLSNDRGPPEIALLALIVNPLPPSGLFQIVGIVF